MEPSKKVNLDVLNAQQIYQDVHSTNQPVTVIILVAIVLPESYLREV